MLTPAVTQATFSSCGLRVRFKVHEKERLPPAPPARQKHRQTNRRDVAFLQVTR